MPGIVYRALGTTDDVTTCEICGKPELKGTVILAVLDADGNTEETIYAGSTCAARRAGGRTTARRIREEANAADYRRRQAVASSREMVDFYAPLEDRPALLAAKYADVNRGYFRNFPDADPLSMARDSLARHRNIIATNGLSVIKEAGQ